MIEMVSSRVYERLLFEGIISNEGMVGRRFRITLLDLVAAGNQMPVIKKLIPAILIARPQLVWELKKHIGRFPELRELAGRLFTKTLPAYWEGISRDELRNEAARLLNLFNHRKSKGKSRNINIRVDEEDLNRLETLAKQEGLSNKSELIRKLVKSALNT